MTDESALVRDWTATQHDVITFADGVHVEPGSRPRDHFPAPGYPFSPCEVFASRNLEIVFASAHEGNAQSGMASDRGVVRKLTSIRGAMRFQDVCEPEPLGCLRVPQPIALDRLNDVRRIAVGPLERIGYGERRYGGRHIPERNEDAIDECVVNERSRGIVNENVIGRHRGGQVLEACAAGGLACRTAMDRRRQLQPSYGAGVEIPVIDTDHDLDRIDAGMAAERVDRVPKHGFSAQSPILLGKIASDPSADSAGKYKNGTASHFPEPFAGELTGTKKASARTARRKPDSDSGVILNPKTTPLATQRGPISPGEDHSTGHAAGWSITCLYRRGSLLLHKF